MTDLKNTPWHTVLVHWDRNLYKVVDSEGFTIVEEIDEPTAKAIANLPETLKEIRLSKRDKVLLLNERTFYKEKFEIAQAEIERLRKGIKHLEVISVEAVSCVERANYKERALEARKSITDKAQELISKANNDSNA